MAIHLLDYMTIKAIKGPQPGKTVMRVADGGGLFLRVTKHTNKAGVERISKSWELYFTMNSKTSCTGMGRFSEKDDGYGLTLDQARDQAAELRRMVQAGRNPIEERKAAKARAVSDAAVQVVTFEYALDEYMKCGWAENIGSEKHLKAWRASLDLHVVPVFADMPIGDITIDDVKRALKPVWSTKTETARRLRMRAEKVFAWAIDEGHRTTDNPASVNALSVWIANQKKAKSGNFPAIQQADMPTWFSALQQREGMAARALEFAALCASRSGEVRGMTWDEIEGLDGPTPLWVLSPDRMKMDKEHTVPLSGDAATLLRALPRIEGTNYVFPAAQGGALSDMALSAVMKRMNAAKVKQDGVGWIDRLSKRPAVPHGLRSTFKDAMTERGVDNILSEIALAHNVGNEVQQRYMRTDLVEQRRAMMNDYAAFCLGRPFQENVVPIRGAV